MSKTDLISVQPRWWIQAAEQATKLASSASRVSKLLSSIEPHLITKEAIEVIEGILVGFSETAGALTLELSAIEDGTSTYLIEGSKGDPGTDPVDLVLIAKAFRLGHVVGDEVLAEHIKDHGDGPDALPKAVDALAARLWALPPESRNVAQLFLDLNRDAGEPTGTQTKAG